MSSEFVFYRCSTQLSDAIEQIGRPAFDAFWDGDLIDDDETWTQEKIQEIFSVAERRKLESLLGKLYLPILREGQKINGYLISTGDFIEGIHFLLTGKRQLTICEFLTQEFLLDSLEESMEKLILVNVIKGGLQIERGNGPDATLLVSSEVREIIDPLKIILEDDFESRWKILQEFDRGFNYTPDYEDPKWGEAILATHREYYYRNREMLDNGPDYEDPKWGEEIIRAAREFAREPKKRLDYRHSRSFQEFFRDPDEPSAARQK